MKIMKCSNKSGLVSRGKNTITEPLKREGNDRDKEVTEK
jgi:hypothetical protein